MSAVTFNWKIAGKAGEGIAATSFMMSRVAARHGLSVFEYSEYPSLIRGGHTCGQVRASREPITCHATTVDIMIALNEDAIALHLDEFQTHTKIFIDTDDDKIDWAKYPQLSQDQIVSIPFVKLAREATGSSLASDVVALAASSCALGLQLDVITQVLADFFEKKGPDVVTANTQAATLGYAFATDHGLAGSAIATEDGHSLLVTGAEAIGLGALSAGVQFYSAYPMTPTSNLMHFMAASAEHHPLVVKHAEDEIAAINEALGASYAGARAMTGTAGGGFALMVEAVSLAGVTELPLVVVVGGRPGPATGLPTWTSQADLLFVLHAGHGEFPRIVFTPGTAEESFKLTRLAFFLAEKYHTQSYIISDKYLLESRMTMAELPASYTNPRLSFASEPLPEDDSYKRFLVTNDGHSPRSIPGQPHGLQLTNSYEHDEHGYATEDALMAKSMVEKRLRKWDGILSEVPAPIRIGPETATVTLVCWGSTRLVVEEVIRTLNAIKPGSVNAIVILTMLPFATEAFTQLAQHATKLVMVEANALAQGATHIRAQTGISIDHHITRYDGRPFATDELIEQLEKEYLI